MQILLSNVKSLRMELIKNRMNIIKQAGKNCRIWFDGDIWQQCPMDFFDPLYWKNQHAIIGQAKGRGQVVFFSYQEQSFVLRHYRRGGLVGQLFSDDRYFFTGKKRSRPWREFALLGKLNQLGLPAPVPVAIRLIREGLFYRADLITRLIPNARDLSTLLVHQRLSSAVWLQVGRVIRQFHDAGVDHSDLNIHNIMLDENGKIWIIDLDKSCIRKPAFSWQRANLERLYRSLEKERQQLPHWYWLKSDWALLKKGYQGVADAVT